MSWTTVQTGELRDAVTWAGGVLTLLAGALVAAGIARARRVPPAVEVVSPA